MDSSPEEKKEFLLSEPKEQVYLLPSAKELAQLSDATAAASLQVLDHAHRREHSYATLAMICGTVGFLACIGIFATSSSTGIRGLAQSCLAPGYGQSLARSSIPG